MGFLKQISAVVFVGLILFRSMVIPVIFLDYELHKEYIIDNFCVNKNKPEMNCDGKCYLAKKLNEAREKEAKSAFSSYLFTMECHFSPYEISLKYIPLYFYSKTSPSYFIKNLSLQNTLFSFFRPPRY